MKTNCNWLCLEDTDGRFRPHPPDETAPEPDVIIGRIRINDEPQVPTIRIFLRPDTLLVAMRVLSDNITHGALSEGFWLLSGTKTEQPPKKKDTNQHNNSIDLDAIMDTRRK